MDFDLDPKTIGISLIMWALLSLSIWFIRWGEGGWSYWHRIFFTIAALPISYVCTAWQINR